MSPTPPVEPSSAIGAVLEGTPDAVALIGAGGKLLGWNTALVHATGLTDGTLAAASIDTVDSVLASIGLDDAAASDEQAAAGRHVVAAPDGRLFERTEQVIDVPVTETGRLVWFRPLDIVGHASDLDRRQLRACAEQRRHALRMEAVGRLAGGIAHDFNNMLTVMIGFAEQLQSDVGERPALTQVVRAAQRAAGLTRQLLAFSRQQVLRPLVVDVASVVTGMGDMIGRLIGDDVQLRIEADEALPSVCADPTQLEQIVLNLAINARDAMRRGGQVTIAVCRVSLQAPPPGRDVQPAGDYVRLSVSDTGEGIAPELLHKVFEPFFTTKGSQGTGLGLSTVYGIVKQSGGFVWVDSTVGSGTTFTVDLPVTDLPKDAAVPSERPGPVGASSSVGCVLVVEDLDAVREVTREMLEADGFRVIEAATPREALALVSDAAIAIDLVLTDVMMPEMTGRDLASAIGGHRPALPVLFMSGLPRALDWNEPGTFLAKPFTRAMLLSHVRSRLAVAANAA